MREKYKEEYNKIIEPIISNENVLEMKKYQQHGNTDCFEHCLNVAYYSFIIAKKLHLDYISLARAGMLHDFFLYNWRGSGAIMEKGFFNQHAFSHGKTAYKNASKYFKLNDKERDIIINHMWPVTIRLPKYKETFIITLTDKYCTLKEMYNYYVNNGLVKYIFYRIEYYNIIMFVMGVLNREL